MTGLGPVLKQLAAMLAMTVAMAGSIMVGIHLHDWVFASAPIEITEPEAPETDQIEVASEPAPLPQPATPVAPAVTGGVSPPTIAGASPEDTGAAPTGSEPRPSTTVVAVSQLTPTDASLSSPDALTLPFGEAGPESPEAVPTSAAASLPAAAASMAWLRHAVPSQSTDDRPMIAIVIDDVGVNTPRNTDRVVALPAPLTLALMSYASNVGALAASARAAGHELLVHVPMEPEDSRLSTGPNALQTGLAADELRRRLAWALSRFDGYVGINNHMGSEFTASDVGMTIVLEEVRRQGLLFLDSKTTADSAGAAVAERLGVPFAERDVFLDNETTVGAVWEQLDQLEQVARRKGYAVAIGHPHDGTLDALAAWLPTVIDRGFVLVPISQIVRRNLATATN